MNNDIKNILSNSNKDIDNQQLMDYLSQQLSHAQQHEVEQSITDDEFMNDAVEGLQQLKNNNQINSSVAQLNHELMRQLEKRKKRKEKRRWKDSPYTYMAALILLLLIIICYVVIKKSNPKRNITGNHHSINNNYNSLPFSPFTRHL